MEYIHFHRYVRNTPSDRKVHAEHQLRADRRTLPEEKNIQNQTKLSRMKELGGKTGVLVGLDLPSVGWGTEAGSNTHIGATVWIRGETFKVDSETAYLWQPKWNENQTGLATAIHTLDKDAVPWKAERLGAGVWGLWSDPRVRAAVDCEETDWGDVREEIAVGNASGGKPGSHGSKVILLSQA